MTVILGLQVLLAEQSEALQNLRTRDPCICKTSNHKKVDRNV